MPPRTRVKGKEKEKEAEQPLQNVPEVEVEGGFAQLAKQHWLKPSKKTTKVKVKPDVLKSEIWDVLERDDFKFSELLSLENLQILERQDWALYWFIDDN
jgi:intron-binding protein aquarius